jgi:hypothetical protein
MHLVATMMYYDIWCDVLTYGVRWLIVQVRWYYVTAKKEKLKTYDVL